MSSGFNSDVNVAGEICHVQTEEHGRPECLIETLVYHRGRILHRRTSNYSDLAADSAFTEDAVRERVEHQHRAAIDEIRDGTIAISPVAEGNARVSDGIQVRLRNANSWLAGGNATLDVQVLRRGDNQPVANATVEANLTGVKQETRLTATTGADGLAQLRFAMPPLGPDGSELVIRANGERGGDEVRYAVRSKAKPTTPEPQP